MVGILVEIRGAPGKNLPRNNEIIIGEIFDELTDHRGASFKKYVSKMTEWSGQGSRWSWRIFFIIPIYNI